MTTEGNDAMAQDGFENLLDRIENVPTLPKVYYTVSSLLENPRVSASDVTREISQDPALTSRILRIVNSAFYGLPQKVSTLTHAVVLMGFNTVKSLLLAMSLSDIFGGKSEGAFPREAFWTHCFATGMTAKSIAMRSGHGRAEEVFILGLLHDIGKIAMDRYMAEEFARACARAREEGCLLLEAEKAELSLTHTDVGRRLADHWNLPESIGRTIGLHHRPSEAGDVADEASIVHLADIVVRAKRLGSGGDDAIPALDPDAWERLGLDWPALERIMAESEQLSVSGAFFQ